MSFLVQRTVFFRYVSLCLTISICIPPICLSFLVLNQISILQWPLKQWSLSSITCKERLSLVPYCMGCVYITTSPYLSLYVCICFTNIFWVPAKTRNSSRSEINNVIVLTHWGGRETKQCQEVEYMGSAIKHIKQITHIYYIHCG